MTQQKQVKEKRDDKLCPEEEKVAKLYKAGKLRGKTFQSTRELNEDLIMKPSRKGMLSKIKMD